MVVDSIVMLYLPTEGISVQKAKEQNIGLMALISFKKMI